ncbi:MAG: hypothetical protein FWC10_00705 [Lentimicrobiaceae bacterium]|nr:hypothetical protein [Lentimicrobiaceae bacterium]
MEGHNWYDAFMDNLHEIFPKKPKLTQEIMDLLCLEREAVYRRLRKDVVFHTHEIVKMASHWNISLDEVVGIDSGTISYQMQTLNYLNPSKNDLFNLQKRIKALDHLVDTPNSEFMEVCNNLPRALGIRFSTIYRFKVFDWAYQYHQEEMHKPLFSKIIIPEKMSKEFDHYLKNILCVKNTHFILDQRIFEYLVQNIRYFHSILLVSDEDKILLKKELFDALDYMEEMANKGCYPETQNKVNLYISKMSIDTNYSYCYSDKLKACRIHAFGAYDISCSDLEMVEKFKEWMHLKKRAAIQISEANEKSRIEFFAKQRATVEGL